MVRTIGNRIKVCEMNLKQWWSNLKGCSSPLLWFLDKKKKKKNLYLQLFVYCDLWSKLVSTCSWQNTTLKADALRANSSNCKTLWWKTWKLSPSLKHSQRSSSGAELQSKRASSAENSWHALVNCYHTKVLETLGEGGVRQGRDDVCF